MDEGDSAMEDGEIDSKVSVSVVFCVYCYVDTEDTIITITEDTPARSGDQVC